MHIAKTSTYVGVFLALMVLTAVTVWVAYFDLGVFSDVVAMGIAITKATLVILFFMHVKGSTKVTKITVVSAFLWLGIFFLLILPDYMARAALIEVPGK